MITRKQLDEIRREHYIHGNLKSWQQIHANTAHDTRLVLIESLAGAFDIIEEQLGPVEEFITAEVVGG